MFERFTDHARRAVVAAQDEARMLGHSHIGSEHLLLGLLHEQQADLVVHVLAAAGVTLDSARAQVEELTRPGGKSPAGHIPFTQRAKKILELSLREALEQKDSHIGTEHILLGLIRDSDGAGAQILQRLGEPLPALRQRILDAVKAAPPDAAAERDADQESREWDWSARGFRRESWVQPSAVIAVRLLTPLDRRLANIERHLGIAADTEAVTGFRGLLTSVERRLASIERHLGIEAGPANPPADAEAE